MDTRSRGAINPEVITQTFNPFQHPDVLSKTKTPQDALQDFTDHFDVGGQVEGRVTKEEFLNYYANISSAISSDDYFEMLIRNCWNLPPSVTKSPEKTTMVRGAGGGQSTQKSKLAAPAPNLLNQLSGMTALQKAKADADPPAPKPTPMEIAYAGPSATLTPANAKPLLPPRVTTGLRLVNTSEVCKSVPAETGKIAPGVSMLISKLKSDVQARGIHGYNELERLFWMMDEDKSTELSLPEFNNVMRELGVNLDSVQLRIMFDAFDKDHSGSISIEEFMDAIRDRLSQGRMKLVLSAFSKLDRNRRGRVKAEDLVVGYDATQHPEVMAGRMSVKACQQEFLEAFDIGKEIEGFATQREFIAYYTNLGCCIINDDYFELLLLNTWKLESEGQRPGSGQGLVSRVRSSIKQKGWYPSFPYSCLLKYIPWHRAAEGADRSNES
jgi:Ca2+-binding EF-hand superfamily protein